VDVVEAEGDREREPIGMAAVAAAGPDLPHLQASQVRRGAARRGADEGEELGWRGYLDGKLAVRDEVVELRRDEGRKRGRRGRSRRGGVGGRRHRRRRMVGGDEFRRPLYSTLLTQANLTLAAGLSMVWGVWKWKIVKQPLPWCILGRMI
jgi:hypothetical protein